MTNPTNGPGQPPQADPDNQPSPNPVLDLATHGNAMVPVKVHGQVLQVPLEEVAAGYQRQQDHTIKAQALAEERNQFAEQQDRYRQMNEFFAQAQRDPQGAIDSLRETYAEQLHATGALGADNEGSDSPEVAALKRQVSALEAGIENDRLRLLIDQERQAVTTTFPELDTDTVTQYAAQKGYQPGQLMEAAKAMRHDVLHTQLEQARAAEQATAAGDQQLANQKAGLPPISAGTAAAGTADSTPVPVIKTPADAVALVMAEQSTASA